MAYIYSELATKTKQWAQEAAHNQWLDLNRVAPLLETDFRNPQMLFIPDQTDFQNRSGFTRPLIVAFMGGTGVGKSSLLNRLAGSAIAKAGIERPTSREVTLYHHQSIAIEHLPDNFPLQKIKISQHHDDAKKHLVWMDMPDFDSTEHSNKDLVLQWLPHIDVLIYVVSPERYRDNKAWQLLLSEGAQHGWLFVLNQWDKGQSAQYDDFKQQLAKAGFQNPLIFRTICTEENPHDEFSTLLATIESLANKHDVQQLELHNLQVKKTQLKQHLQQCESALNQLPQFQPLLNHWQKKWREQEKLFKQGFAWSLQQFASRYARSNVEVMVKNQPLFLWDEWAQSRFEDGLDDVVLTAEQLHIPSAPLREKLFTVRETVGKNLHQACELGCRQALVHPGNAMQRGFLKLAAVCEVVLPLLTLSWVAYQVFHGYYESAIGTKAYLGVDFVTHSSLLVLVSGLLPYFVTKKMQPSLEKAALRGLQKGLDLALAAIDYDVQQRIMEHQTQQQHLLNELKSYIAECDEIEKEKTQENPTLARMLVD